ncbi:MAG: hypothetical protein ACXWUL_10205 [Caldimonas sp.]
MAEAFASGRIVDAILALVIVEAALLLILRRRLGHGPSFVAIVGNLGAGLFLLLALRAALVGSEWPWMAASLALALLAHLIDIAQRWRRPPP